MEFLVNLVVQSFLLNLHTNMWCLSVILYIINSFERQFLCISFLGRSKNAYVLYDQFIKQNWQQFILVIITGLELTYP